MNKFIYTLAVILFAVPVMAQTYKEILSIGEMEIDGSKVIITDIFHNEIKNNIVFKEEDMVLVENNDEYLNQMNYGKYKATIIAQRGCSEEREETKKPHSKGDLETSTAFHKQPKAFRICFQMNKPDFF